MAFCSQCGTQMPDDSRFCPTCGASMVAAPAAPSAPPAAPPAPPAEPVPSQGYQAGPQYQQANTGYQGPQYQQAGPQYQTYQPPVRTYTPDGDAHTLGVGAVSVLAYWGIFFFIPLVAYKDSRFARFHAGQGLNLLLTYVAYGIVMGILTAIFTAISWGLGAVIGTILSLGYIALFVFMVLGIVNACKGEMKPLPVIGNIQIIKL